MALRRPLLLSRPYLRPRLLSAYQPRRPNSSLPPSSSAPSEPANADPSPSLLQGLVQPLSEEHRPPPIPTPAERLVQPPKLEFELGKDNLTLTFDRALLGSLVPQPSYPATPSIPPGATRYKRMELPYAWLRTWCKCPSCVDPSTHQRRVSRPGVDYLPYHQLAKPQEVTVAEDQQSITIRWKKGHESTYPLPYLFVHHSKAELAKFRHSPPRRRVWQAKDYSAAFTELRLTWPLSEKDHGEALFRLLKYGLVFLKDVSREEKAIEQVAAAFGEIEKTFYGETWDVRSVPDSKNVAYTDQLLGLHQDLLYMRHPPAYQILHCIDNQVTGGTSSFCDGLFAAYQLAEEQPRHFRTLTYFVIPFEYDHPPSQRRFCSHLTIDIRRRGEGRDDWYHHLIERNTPTALGRWPALLLGKENENRVHVPARTNQLRSSAHQIREAIKDLSFMRGYHVAHINFSPPFQAPFPVDHPNTVAPALRAFAQLVNSEENVFRYRLEEGDCVIFDNRRVLHARKAFDAQQGKRWLRGCYLGEDSVVDQWRRTAVAEDRAYTVEEEVDHRVVEDGAERRPSAAERDTPRGLLERMKQKVYAARFDAWMERQREREEKEGRWLARQAKVSELPGVDERGHEVREG